jgi:hypothetical protein
LDKFQQIFGRLRSPPWNPETKCEIYGTSTIEEIYRFAWLIMPFPPKMGITDVDAVLKETTSPSDVNGEWLDGRLL